MSPALRIQLLGGFRLLRPNGEPESLGSGRVQELLAYLVLHREASLPRQRIAFAFWPDSPDGQALTNLRQVLHGLRSDLPETEELLEIRRQTLAWRPDAPARVDVIEVDRALEQAGHASRKADHEAAIEHARQAATLYRGDLLPECYDPWIDSFRKRLKEDATRGIDILVRGLELRRNFGEAVQWAHRLVELDPYRESSRRSLIRLQALAGEPAAALQSYRTLEELWSRELGMEPSPETRALVDHLRGIRPPEASPEEEDGEGGARAGTSGMGAPAEESWPLVGRHREWEQLCTAWEKASGGEPALVLIEGEAGIGKSRLADTFAAAMARRGAVVARARCWEAEGPLPFSPVSQWLNTRHLINRISRLDGRWREEIARLIPHLSQSRSRSAAPTEGSAEPWRRLRLFEGLARGTLAGREPLLLVLDDLQWCDRDTLEWVHYLLRFDATAPLLLLATLRSGEPGSLPQFQRRVRALHQLPRTRRLELQRLDPEETVALAQALTGRELDPDEARDLHHETEGNPLFVVEILRLGTDGEDTPGKAPLRSGALPERIRGMIRSRLGQLSEPARRLLPLLATIGRDFRVEVLRHASDASSEDLVLALQELVRRQVLRERADGALDFAHDKIREVAFQEITATSRALLHERVARALEQASLATPGRMAARVAWHLEQAGLRMEAIPWREQAAREALDLHAYPEAVDHLDRALAAVAARPESSEELERELKLRTAMGVPLVAMDHYSGPRVWQTYRRAGELCAALDRPASPPVLRALALASLMRGRLSDVVELGTSLMDAARRDEDPMLGVEAHYVLGVVRYWQGRMETSQEHLSRALELYRPERFPEHVALFAQDPAVVCGVRLALTEWHLGMTEQAHRRCLDALERARTLDHPVSLAYARCFGSWVLIECGDLAAARRETSALVREAPGSGVAVWSTWGRIAEGYLLAHAGNVGDGVGRIQTALERLGDWDLTLGHPYHQGLLARALTLAGRTEEALEALDDGLAMAEATEQRFWDPVLLQMKDELLRPT